MFPDASITFLVKAKYATLLINNPHLSKVITYDDAGKGELKRITRQLREEHFDWFIDLHKSLRTRYIRLNTSFSEVTGYNKQILARTLLIYFGINRFKTIKPVYLRYFEAVRKYSIHYDDKGTEVYASHSDNDIVNRQLKADGITGARQLVVICPGASYKNKQWLPERFAEVAISLHNDSSTEVVMLGGSADSRLCDGIIALTKKNIVSYAGKFSLLQSAALLQRSALVITNDSGMMHLAQSQKVPVVAIFGATSRELGFYPFPQKSVVVEKEVSCRPCTHKGLNHCPRKHFNCMNRITTADVLTAAQSFVPEIKS